MPMAAAEAPLEAPLNMNSRGHGSWQSPIRVGTISKDEL